MVKSSKPKKQRRFFHKMPLHKRQKSVASTLSKALRKSLGIRSISLRKGDKVKVVRGKHRGTEAKVTSINYQKLQVFLEKIVLKRNDGTEKPVPLHASNLVITDIDRSDARRAGKAKLAKPKTEEKAKKKEVNEKDGEKKAKKAPEKKAAKEKKKVKTDGEKGREKKPKKA